MRAVNDDRMIMINLFNTSKYQTINNVFEVLKQWLVPEFLGDQHDVVYQPESSDSEDICHQKQALCLIKGTPQNLH